MSEEESLDYNKISWEIINKFLKDNKKFLVNHHLHSYNKFFKKDLKNIFYRNNPISFYKKKKENIRIQEDFVDNLKLYDKLKDKQEGGRKYINKETFKNDFYPKKTDEELDELWEEYKKEVDVNREESIKDEFLYQAKMYIGGKDGSRFYYGKPMMYDKNNKIKKYLYPNEARLRNMTYAFTLYVDILIEFVIFIKDETKGYYEKHISRELIEKIYFGKYPIMLQSELCILKNLNKTMRFNLGECKNDYGGYFIIDGKEKAIVTQETLANNIVYIEKKKDKNYIYQAVIKSVSEDVTKSRRKLYVRMIKPTNSCKNGQIVVEIPNIRKPIPLFILMRALGVISDKEIIKCCLLDLNKYEMMMEHLRPSAHDVGFIYTQFSALKFIKSFIKSDKYRQNTDNYLMNILTNDFLPHIGERNFRTKALYIGYMVKKLLFVTLNIKKETNRDNYICKRFEVSGKMIADLFNEYYKKQLKKIFLVFDKVYHYEQKQEEKYGGLKFKNLFGEFNEPTVNDKGEIIKNNNILKVLNLYVPRPFGKGHDIIECNKIVEEGFRRAFKGDWGLYSHTKRIGVIQDLNRLSYWSSICHLRKTNVPLPAGSDKLVQPRLLNSTQWGILCPIHSPDGGNIGLHKHLALLSHITDGYPSHKIIHYLLGIKKYEITLLEFNRIEEIRNNTKIIVNGNWFAMTNKPKLLIDDIRLKRRNGLFDIFTSISWDIENKEIIIWCDQGRGCHPLVIVNNGKIEINKILNPNNKWKNLLLGDSAGISEIEDIYNIKNQIIDDLDKDVLKSSESIIEYLDTQELQCMKIISEMNLENLKKDRITHSEIHPSLILGLMANQIIFPSNNPYPRNTFSCGQSKQAVSLFHTNYQLRMDKTSLLLHYGQIPLIKSKFYSKLTKNLNPYGINAIVAIMCYSGYNVEDAIIVNEGSLKRGLFRTTYFSTYETETENKRVRGVKIENKFLQITNENIVKMKMDYDYSLLGINGIIEENQKVNDKTILIGKVKKNQHDNFYVDESIGTKKGQLGHVDKTFLCDFKDGERLAKVRIRHDRIPAIGDKFCSRAGQKGTIGIILPEEDMPFTENGLKPDIIVNPHAMPSRMTIGHLIEALNAKSCCLYGGFGDCTAFENKGPKHKEFGDLLISEGFHSSGNEIMYNGMTGEQLETEIYIGPTYYERLKHMVKDKINYRSRGKRDALTRQTVGGRANDGGLRIGEMDRDAVLSHGLATFLNESMMERGDKYQMVICNKSGTIAIHNPYKNLFLSPILDGPIKFEFDNDGNPSIIPMSKFGKDFSIINVPYAFKLLYQELVSLNVQMRIITEDNVDKLTSLTNKNQIFKLMNKKLYNKKYKKNIKKYITKIKEMKKATKFDTDSDIEPVVDGELPGIYDINLPDYMKEIHKREEKKEKPIQLIDITKAFQFKDIGTTQGGKFADKKKLFDNHINESCFKDRKGKSFNGEIWLNNVATFSITNCFISKIITDFIYDMLTVTYQIDMPTIADCTASVGGNSMSFIRKFNKTISVEKNRNMVAILKKNLDLIKEKMRIKNDYQILSGSFLSDDILENIQKNADVLFLDPPWCPYGKCKVDYSKMMSAESIKLDGISITKIILDVKTGEDNIQFSVLKVPKNYNFEEFKDILRKNDNLKKIRDDINAIQGMYIVKNKGKYNRIKINKYDEKSGGVIKMMIIVIIYKQIIEKPDIVQQPMGAIKSVVPTKISRIPKVPERPSLNPDTIQSPKIIEEDMDDLFSVSPNVSNEEKGKDEEDLFNSDEKKGEDDEDLFNSDQEIGKGDANIDIDTDKEKIEDIGFTSEPRSSGGGNNFLMLNNIEKEEKKEDRNSNDIKKHIRVDN